VNTPRVLVACEFSGAVRDAFRRRGFEAWSCDLEGVEPEGEYPNYHLFGDVRDLWDVFGWRWDLVIAHPPCTFLANSGAKHLYRGARKENGPDPARWAAMWKAAAFYSDMLEAPADHVCVENPIMLGYAREFIQERQGRESTTQIVQPWQFGHGETKATVLELIGLPPLAPTNVVAGREQKIWKMGPGPDRQKNRSRTFAGVAEAMASQWGTFISAKDLL